MIRTETAEERLLRMIQEKIAQERQAGYVEGHAAAVEQHNKARRYW